MPRKPSTSKIERDIKQFLGKYDQPRGESMPTKFPKTIKHGAYTAVFTWLDRPRFDGDILQGANWAIKRRGKVVGKMHEGTSYGWGRPSTTMTELTWAKGGLPAGASSPKSPDYGMAFDPGPANSYADAMAKFAKAADRLIAWRAKNKGK